MCDLSSMRPRIRFLRFKPNRNRIKSPTNSVFIQKLSAFHPLFTKNLEHPPQVIHDLLLYFSTPKTSRILAIYSSARWSRVSNPRATDEVESQQSCVNAALSSNVHLAHEIHCLQESLLWMQTTIILSPSRSKKLEPRTSIPIVPIIWDRPALPPQYCSHLVLLHLALATQLLSSYKGEQSSDPAQRQQQHLYQVPVPM